MIDRAWTEPHTTAELNDVALEAQGGNERAKTKLAEMMRPYVIAMTRQYANSGDYSWEQKDDIKQTAWLGVWLALEGFDSTQAKFSTYAHYYMRREVFQWKAKNSRALPLSRRAWEQSLRVEQAYREKHGEHADIFAASDEELANLVIADTDDKSKTRTVQQAGDIMRAKRASTEIDPDLDVRSNQSAEDEFFEMQDQDADALATLEEMMAAPTPDAAMTMALDFCDRHGLPYDIADRMMEAET